MEKPQSPPRIAITKGGITPKMETCHFPNCRTLVRTNYLSRLCTEHAHTPNLCKCRPCQSRDNKEAARQRAEAKVRAARRENVRIYRPASQTYGEDTKRIAHVALVAEPWTPAHGADTPQL